MVPHRELTEDPNALSGWFPHIHQTQNDNRT
jgi:hypothetical protein